MAKIVTTVFLSIFLAFSTNIFAQSDASASAYDDGWQTSDNDGSGFGAWSLSTSGTAGHFAASSTGNGDGDGNSDSDINTGGRAWGMFANSGGVASAVRSFSTALTTGSVFTIRMDNGFIQSSGSPTPTAGFGLQNASGENLLELFFIGGDSEYRVSDASGSTGTGLAFTDEGLDIQITLRSATTYKILITRIEGGSPSTYSQTGSLISPSGGQIVSQVRLFNSNAGSGSSNDVYFNSMEVSQDNTAPACRLISFVGSVLTGGVQDTESGLESITLVSSNNVNVNIPTFTAGTTVEQIVTVTITGANPFIAIQVTDCAGNSQVCDPVYTTLSTNLPENYKLAQNFPNPFNPSTTIHFGLAPKLGESTFVTLKIFDAAGQEVKTLISETMAPGEYSIEWDGTNNNNRQVAGGMYLYQLITGDFVQTRKMVLLK